MGAGWNPAVGSTAAAVLPELIRFPIDKRREHGQTLTNKNHLPYMPALCKHPQVRVVAREEDVEFVECQLCGEVFDSSEFPDILSEEEATAEAEDQA